MLQKKFGDRLVESLRKYHNRAIETAQVIEELLKMAQDFKGAISRDEALGLSADEVAFYDALAERPEVLQTMGDQTLKALAAELTEQLRQSTTVDWQVRESVRAKMRLLIKRLLRKYRYPPEGQESAVEMVLTQAELFADAWSSGEPLDNAVRDWPQAQHSSGLDRAAADTSSKVVAVAESISTLRKKLEDHPVRQAQQTPATK